ncbi:hypothetical protein ON010_g7772 [Phytophthora cinnamomi]|nr:hypothetical protein ON010_g7772 [Phytophthora cinnamomi]
MLETENALSSPSLWSLTAVVFSSPRRLLPFLTVYAVETAGAGNDESTKAVSELDSWDEAALALVRSASKVASRTHSSSRTTRCWDVERKSTNESNHSSQRAISNA